MNSRPQPSASAPSRRVAGRTLIKALLSLLLAGGSAAFGQSDRATPPLSALLPASTVVAFHASDLDVPRGFWEGALQSAGLAEVLPILERLLALAGEEAAHVLGGGELTGEFEDMKRVALAELAEECPAVAGQLDGFDHSTRWGSVVVGVSVSQYNPLPGVVAVLRPADPQRVADIYRELVYCFASEVSLSQDGVQIDAFGDGSDQPLITALLGGDIVVATNVDLTRAAIRLANGANEPSHLHTPIGQLASNMMSGGVGMTVDFAAIAHAARGLIGAIPTGEESAALVLKLLASLETVSGMAVNATFDGAGLVFSSVVTVDDSHGESELATLTLGTGAPLDPPVLIPRGAAMLSVGHFSLPAFVDWIDSWLAAAEPVIGERLDVRGLAAEYLGVDLDAALLGWIGTTWHVAEHEVPSTDLFSYLVGMEGVFTVPVTSEAAALEGIDMLVDMLARIIEEAGAFADVPYSDYAPTDQFLADGMSFDDTVSVKAQAYRGVPYERWRLGPLTDVGVGVFGGHLVVANPAATMSRVIDVYLGGPNVLGDANIGHLVTSQSASQSGYEIIDLPRYLRGVSQIADAASAPLATAVRALLREAVAAGELTASVDELPTFAELVTLGDFAADLLTALAARTGVAVGSSEVVGSALWSTFRVPLR